MILFTEIISTVKEYAIGDKSVQMKLTLKPITNMQPLTADLPKILFPFTLTITITPVYKDRGIIYSKSNISINNIDYVVWMDKEEYQAFKDNSWEFYHKYIFDKIGTIELRMQNA